MKRRYTLKGIMEKKTLSINVPMINLVKEADYCGIVSGVDTDKVKDCHFEILYGKLKTVPMIEQCTINLECSVIHILGSNSHAIVVSKIDSTYISAEYLRDGKPDFDRLKPLLWFAGKSDYIGIGKSVGKSWIIGKDLKA